ncbi:MAG TPA: DivIVA domain-containing protein [Pseudonocardiaceae bacterium]
MARRITAEDVRDVAFDRPAIGQRGYLASEVDQFLDRVEATLAGTTAEPLTAADVHAAAFGAAGRFRDRGYSMDQVDAFLELVSETLDGPRD